MKKQKNIGFLLTHEQWLGIAILVILAGMTLLFLHHFQPPKEAPIVTINDSTLTRFSAHQAQQDSIRKAQWKKKYPRDTIAIQMQTFDPNTADSSTLVHLGLKKWQVSNMLKYRAKNGRYRKAEDMRKLYGMTDSMYQALLPYIQIDTLVLAQFCDSLRRDRCDTTTQDTTSQYTMRHYISYKRDTILNLRTADTTELKMIPGIGSYRAKQIIHYRKQLGGFVSVEQLREIRALQPLLTDSLSADSLLAHFVLDSVIVEPLRINSMRIERLQKHPYLSFEQAKAIYELRRQKIQLDNIDQLQHLEGFTSEQWQRLSPYLNFEKREK
ncbi:MAG: helix-hairpin-helix domain-containing protein [Paludibacteraceae bacterium]|nr:helix-hairpin-helix domain-containing protein [Paludibacteraceae bacterium]